MSNHISRIPRPFVSTAFATIALALVAFVSAPSTPAMSGEKEVSGMFFGQSNHVTTGKVTVKEENGRTIVILHGDFSLDGAPDPTVGFSNGDKFDTKTDFAKLKSLKGEQRYEVPAGIVASNYDTFTVWCRKFAVPLGSARLK